MMEYKTKQQLRAELVIQGYGWSYVDSWQPHVNMWCHRDWLNEDGVMVKPAGTLVPNQPGHPDHQSRLSRRGLLPWPPGEGCRCKGCRERREVPAFEPPPVDGPEDEGPPVVTVAMGHPARHKFEGRGIGATCTVAGCTASRQVGFARRPQRKSHGK